MTKRASKRAHGEGSIQKLPSGKWRARVSVQGRRLSYTAERKEEAAAWLRQTSLQIERGLSYDAARVSLGEYLGKWLANVESSVRPATFAHYKILVEKRLVPSLGSILVKDLTPDHVQFVYDGWIQQGTGAHTVVKAHAVLHQALERASKTGLAYRNVCDLVSTPKAAHKEMRFWTEAESSRFLTASMGNRLYALFHLALVTGARQMELLGLKWDDLDPVRGTLHICRQLSRHGDLFAPIKTKAGNRTIVLGAGTLALLREHLERQEQERRAIKRWQEHNLIFTNTTGRPIHHKNLIDRYFKPLVKAAGVPEIRFHDLRHTAVSIMLSNGISVFVVSKIVGHARPSITSDTYGHLVPGAVAGIGEMMDELISPVRIKLPSIGHELDTGT